jgi:glycosyltransferase involved in cell wall biosynthesis
MKKLSVVIPVFNEVGTVDTVLERVFAQEVPGWEKEVVVVDDASTDGTRKKLEAWKKRCTVILKERNEGKGSAVTEGLKHAGGDVIIIQDADLEYNPAEYPSLLAPFDNPAIDIVYGSRFLGPHMSTKFVYAAGNRLVTFMTNFLYNSTLTDSETGYKVFRRAVIDGVAFRSKKFDFDPEFSAKALKRGYRIFEVPITYIGRKHSEGKKLNWWDGLRALRALVTYRFAD